MNHPQSKGELATILIALATLVDGFLCDKFVYRSYE